MTLLTEKQGKRLGAILVEGKMFMSPEEEFRYRKFSGTAGAAFQVEGYLRKAKWWEFWR